jgi:mannose-6-phosphate isomerase-like protein (cupin superfamily)
VGGIVVRDSGTVEPTIFTGRESRRVISPERDGSTRMSLHRLHNFERGVTYEVKYEDNDEILYILEGEGYILDGDERIPFKPDSAVFIPAGTPYRIYNPTDLKMLAILSPPRYREDWKGREDLVQLEPGDDT